MSNGALSEQIAARRDVSLDDKYQLESGQLYMTGSQALVRLPLAQLARDKAQGLNTACFISGYRGSPMHNLDKELWRAERFLERGRIHFQPAVNEDLAATSLWGSQQSGLFGDAAYDGVFGMWYGKGPGLDRSLDAIRHANLAGTSPHGGVLAIVGDDHGMASSDVPATSEPTFMDLMLPTLYPASVQELIDLGLMGIALSRFSGAWVGFKAVSDTLDAVASVHADPLTPEIVIPTDFEFPADGVHIREPDPWKLQEPRLRQVKLAAALAFAQANQLNCVLMKAPRRRFGIVASGKGALDVMQALADLGLNRQAAADIGIEVLKISMPFPADLQLLRKFSQGLEEVLVVEEKRRIIEVQLKDALYTLPDAQRPKVVGRSDEHGNELLSPIGEMDADRVAIAIAARISRFHDTDKLRSHVAFLAAKTDELSLAIDIGVARTPYFCSGCPHNSSTRVPDGALALGGVGCHFMATYMDRDNLTHTHMGGEGANWIGMAPFVKRKHIFQNMGDGTYFHSGLLAIRACIAANVSITYKILFNDAVAMTGGQPVDGNLTPAIISHQVRAEGAVKIIVVTEDLSRSAPLSTFAAGTRIEQRDDLDRVQRELAEVGGVSVLIYDQTCAAEKRRRRKRGELPDPDQRAFINKRVCEGCGDCGDQSNCLSVVPVATPLGMKRQIDQSSCNKDFSCVKGFCPSFVTVHGAAPRKQAGVAEVPRALQLLPEPARVKLPNGGTYNVLVTGVGGTGVVTVGAMLTMAAHLEGLVCSSVDQFGMAQKGGAVTSHIRLAHKSEHVAAVRLGAGAADLVLGCDNLVAASDAALLTIRRGHTQVIVNTHQAITGQFVRNPNLVFPLGSIEQRLGAAAGDGFRWIEATKIATELLGDAIAANLFMLGFAYQRGLIPVAAPSIERAIELNQVAVDNNKAAFAWGRRAAFDADAVRALLKHQQSGVDEQQSVDTVIADFRSELAEYQDDAYASRFGRLLERVTRAEAAAFGASGELSRAVATSAFRLMAYKDEYEVARLYTDGQFEADIAAAFTDVADMDVHLAPPLLSRPDPHSGRPRKFKFGSWAFSAMRVLAQLKGLRGGLFDVFGYSQERRDERAWVERYFELVDSLLTELAQKPLATSLRVAKAAQLIRGYGPIKAESMARAESELNDALALWQSASVSDASPAAPETLSNSA